MTVSDKVFKLNPANFGRVTVTSICGFNRLFSESGCTKPYTAWARADRYLRPQTDVFKDNRCTGPWNFAGSPSGQRELVSVDIGLRGPERLQPVVRRPGCG